MINKISVIIPTLDRPEDLKKCLLSISQNSILPDEILIIEQGDFEKTKKIISLFLSLNIKAFYFEEKSLTKAKNFGVKESFGDILFFLDDDVVLEKEYIKVAQTYLNKNSKVLGIVGQDLIYKKKYNSLFYISTRILGILFCVSSFKQNSVVLRSGENQLRNVLNKVADVEWLSGGISAVRKTVFKEGLKFNPNFILWSFGEDAMFSYQIYKKYGKGSLKYLPTMQLRHYHSQSARIVNKKLIRMKIIYRYIFWKTETTNGSIKYTLAYLLSQFAIFLFHLVQYKNFKVIKYTFEAYLYLYKNKKRIIENNIAYNKFITENDK